MHVRYVYAVVHAQQSQRHQAEYRLEEDEYGCAARRRTATARDTLISRPARSIVTIRHALTRRTPRTHMPTPTHDTYCCFSGHKVSTIRCATVHVTFTRSGAEYIQSHPRCVQCMSADCVRAASESLRRARAERCSCRCGLCGRACSPDSARPDRAVR